MAQDVKPPLREQRTDDEDWFDLRSLAPVEDAGDSPVEAWPGRRARAYYASSPPSSGPPVEPPAPASWPFEGTELRVEPAFGPFLYFAFLLLIPVASVALFVLSSTDPSYEEPSVDERALTQNVVPTPPTAARRAMPSHPLRPSATLRVDSDPEGAFVYVDGALAGITPYEADTVESGWRTVVLRLNDRAERDTLLYVEPETATTLALALEPLRADPASPTAPERPPASEAEEVDEPEAGGEAPAREVGALRVEATPAGAVVHLGGEAVGRTPLLLEGLAPKMYEVTLSMPGYASYTHRVDVGPGRRASVRADLVALPGTLSVLVHPWGSIYVDGTLLARDTDLRRSIDVPAGPHVIRVEHPVLGAQERRVDVRAGQTTSVDFDLL